MKTINKIFALTLIILLVDCTQKADNEDLRKLLCFLKIDTNIVITNKDAIVENEIPFDTLKKEISLFKFNKVQKALITSRLKPLNQSVNYGAYLYLVENRIPKINTFVIYTDSDFGSLIYLVNFNDTALVDYLYNDGNYGYPIKQTEDKEIIEGFNQRFEFHNDTIFKIKKRIIKYNFFDEKKKAVEYRADSIITIYRISQSGTFQKIHYDSIPGSVPK